MSELTEQPNSKQRFSLFHGGDAAEAGLRAWHAPYADAFRSCGEVADIGCGPGYFLDLLRERGVHGTGIDIDPAMVEAARARGHDARVGDQTALAGFQALGGIHLSHIIEHLWGDDALALLEASYAALAGGGILIVRTPNWGNATVRHGGFWLDHTHKRPYPLELLSKLLSDIGFEIIQADYEKGGWEDTFVVARKPQLVQVTVPEAVPIAVSAARARIFWHGDFLGEGSLARLNRHLVRAVVAQGAFEIIPCGETTPLVEHALGLPSRRVENLSDGGPPVVTLRHRWPPFFMNPSHGHYVQMQPWEFGSPPKAWIEPLRQRADDVWCNSTYVRDVFASAGIEPERLHVLPEGFDPKIYHPGVEPLDTDNPTACVFLFVGAIMTRKNLPKLVEAYTKAFTKDDNVALFIKYHDLAGISQDETVASYRALAQRTDIPPVRFIEGVFSDADIARLYRTATALVHPYRAEGFGLPILEAMACGTPVVVTKGGSTDDFVDDTVGYQIPSYRVPIGRDVDGMELAGEGWWLEVNTNSLIDTLQHIAQNRDEARAKGKAAAERAHASWTWAHAAQHVATRLDELLATPARPHVAAADDLNAYENKAYSQNGEDGMLLEIFSRLRVVEPFFAEFGVETGSECNSAIFARYAWRGLMIEGDPAKFAQLQRDYQQFPGVRTVNAFVDRDNIADIFRRNGVPVGLDLLSIDVDGNDYHLWEALAAYRARVVIVEINPAYPPPQRWVMAYNPQHQWRHDNYYGASLASYAALGERLGYALLTTDRNAVNAIFLQADLVDACGFPPKAPADAYHTPRYRFPHREGPALIQ